MAADKIKLLIKQGEGYNLELKKSLPSKASDLAVDTTTRTVARNIARLKEFG